MLNTTHEHSMSIRRTALRLLFAASAGIVGVAGIAVGASAANAATTTPALGCQPQSGVGAVPGSLNSDAAIDTSINSAWQVPGGIIDFSESGTASASLTESASVSLSASDIITSADATFGISLTKSDSSTQTWTYSNEVPPSWKVSGRMQVWDMAAKFQVGDWQVVEDCQTEWSNKVTVYAPYAANNSSYYAISIVGYSGLADTPSFPPTNIQ